MCRLLVCLLISLALAGCSDGNTGASTTMRAISPVASSTGTPSPANNESTVNHIALGKNAASWDLSLQPQARCTLTIQSDIPTQSVGLDRMKGSFSCPRLFSSAPEHPRQPIAVSDGTFDVAIIVES